MKLKKLLLPAALSILAAFTGNKASAQVSSYGFAQSAGTYTPVSASGTIVANATGTTTFDTEGWNVSLPFTFQFNGTGYTSIYVNSNGGATFGSTTSTGSALISSTTGYDGALAVMNRDLWAMFVTEGTRTTGSTTITGVTNFTGLDIGDTLVGTGIPTNTSVVAFSQAAGTIEMSAASTSNQTAAAVRWPAGSVRTEVLGSAPNRTFVIEWHQFSDYSTSVNNTTFDFQIHLEETSNVIRYVYGPFASTLSTTRTNQVGLRGASNTDYYNRTAALPDGFANTAVGTSNSATVARDNTNFPASGLTFSWTPPSCLVPSNLAFLIVTSTGATLTWTAPTPAPAQGYQYEVRSSGAAGSGAAGLEASGNTGAGVTTAAVTGLSNTTTYTVYVRSNCGSGSYSNWTAGVTFLTACPAIAAPYSEGFNAGSLPACWINTNSINSTTANLLWKFTGAPGYGTANNGRPNGTFTWLDASSPYNAVVTLNSPVIDLSNLASPYLKFDWFKNNEDTPPYTNNNLKLEGYDGTGWVTLFDDTSNAAAWRTVQFTLPASFIGIADAQFRFSVDKSLSNDFYDDILLDSFSVASTPTCFVPSLPTVTAVTSNSATASWTAPTPAPAQGYQYEVRSSGAAGSGTTGLAASGNTASGSTTANLTGLAPVTTYTFFVRGICAAGDTSAWVGSSSFTTSCAPYTVPFLEEFTATTFPPACWSTARGFIGVNTTTFTGTTTGWGSANYLYTASLGKAARINLYSNTKRDWLITPSIDLGTTPGNYDLGFKIGVTDYASTTIADSLGSDDSVAVVISYDDGATWSSANILRTWTAANGAIPGQNVIIPLTNVSGIIKVAFYATEGTINDAPDYDVYIDSVTLNVNTTPPCTPPVVALGNDTAICVGSSLTLDAGNAGATYLWSTGATSQSISVTAAGSYSVAVTNAGGCTGYDTINVSTNPLPVVALGNDTTFCAGGSLTLDAGNAGASYLWSTGATTQTISVNASGTYSVTVTTAGGCIGRDTMNVTVNPLPVVALGNDTTICGGGSLTLDAGNAGATYLWSNGATTQSTTITTAGTYSVAVTNAAGCTASDTIDVTTAAAPVVALGNDTTYCGSAGPVLLITLDAGNPGATYLWSTGATTQSISVSTSGSYSVTVTNAAGCTGRDTINVTVNPLPVAGTINITNQSPTFTFAATGSANVTTHIWRFGDGATATTANPTHTYTANGTYTVTHVVTNSCGSDSVIASVQVTNVGVNTVSLDGQVSLYPNPAADFVTVENTAAQAMKTIRILDVAGSLVSEVKATGSKTQRLDVSSLASGTYLVRIELEGGAVALRKLQVKR